MFPSRSPILVLIALILSQIIYGAEPAPTSNIRKMGTDQTYDRDYTLTATMLGYFDSNGTRNPVLKAEKGDLVRITIINGENMTHDIALDKLGIKSETLAIKGKKTSIVFTAEQSDIYFCSIPGHRIAGMEGKFKVVDSIEKIVTIEGEIPQKDGRALNFGFEKGTLQDWKATGDAFSDTPIYQDSSPVHDEEVSIGLSGKYFLSSGGTEDYEGTGTLTSVPFTVTQPFASFKVSGGALQDTRVELVRTDNNEVIYQITGAGRATLQPVVVELKEHLDEEIFIRIVDNETGVSPIPYIGDDKWAHINFDDFLFYPVRPNFPNELKPDDIVILPPLDPVLNSGLSAEEAVEAMTMPDGFSVALAAAEPDVVRPISFTLDSRGRLWVAEAHDYPDRTPKGEEGPDRILIFEDTDGNGSLDKRKVFMDGLKLVSSIEIGMGGVWVASAPNLLYIPIDENTDKPAGPPQIVLDGWGLHDTHEILNNLKWGPDGWLYGTHGVFTQSNVGKPGTPDEERTRINGGIWRYHPTKKIFERFSEGFSNPWGIDFNVYGHAFTTVCVIPHMFQAIQGARYLRQAGNHFNPYTYDDIKDIADHVHWVGDRGPHAGNNRSNSKGGGHAHAGAMIYLGSEQWPDKYRNKIFMNNIHGARVNVDQLSREGSGYVAGHGEDFLLTNDSWSQWLNFRYGPSGSVFAIDWYDKNQCHSPNPDVHNKTLGRIFKISHETDEWVQVDLSKASNMELVEYQLEENEWYVRTARLILQERGPNRKVHKALKKIFYNNPDVTRKLRALWSLHVTEGLKDKELLELLDHDSEHIRSWAIQLMAEDKDISNTALIRFAELAKTDDSALVRLYLAAALQRIESEKRWKIIAALVQRAEDRDDHNIPLMLWYAFEPMVPTNVNKAVEVALQAKVPNILPFTVKRLGAMNSEESVKALKNLQQHMDEIGHSSHKVHETQKLIKKELAKTKETSSLSMR